MSHIMVETYYFFCFQIFNLKDGGVAVIEDSILDVLKQANKPRVLFFISNNYFTSWGNYFLYFCHLIPLSVIEKCVDYIKLLFLTLVSYICRQFCFYRLFY